MIIRPAIERDAAILASLSTQLGYPSSPDQLRRRLTMVLGRSDHAVYVATHDESVLGWLHVFVAERLETDLFAEIGGLVVDSSHRGSGIGTALLAKAEEWARDRGCRTLRVRSNVVREEAHRFYEERGYRRAKQQAVFDKRVEGSGA